ncbi:MAG: hypothetical protein ACXWT5_13570 [Methylophilus sp.]
MNRFIHSILATILALSVFTVFAATTQDNKDDGSAIGTSDTPQIKEQMKSTDKNSNAGMLKKGHGNKTHQYMKMMDTNNDGLVSKEEYMTSQEKTYENMNPSSDGVKY